MSYQKEAEYGLLFSANIKMFHWTSKNYDEHKILDELYSDFGDSLDRLIEGMISRDIKGKTEKKDKDLKFDNPVHLIDSCIDHYTKLSEKVKFPEIQNISADICEKLGKAKYLLKMIINK